MRVGCWLGFLGEFGWGGALLGPEESGAVYLDGYVVAGCLVVVWLLDSGREHLCSCLLRSMSPCLCGPCCWLVGVVWVGVLVSVFVVFVCVATSYEGRMVDALASRADEGRRSLR